MGLCAVVERLETLLELKERRADDLDRVAGKAMLLLATESLPDVLDRLKPKAKRGTKGAISKKDAFGIYNSVVALAKAENISQKLAAARLSKLLGFPMSKWLSI